MREGFYLLRWACLAADVSEQGIAVKTAATPNRRQSSDARAGSVTIRRRRKGNARQASAVCRLHVRGAPCFVLGRFA